ncbi:hypothetical protein ACFWWM_02835 [Streptomyces sp. NPDC058682]|uniref:hypothetical protein n=1 Tax=Streptomyces sp. NPDC058682 TaxID=3346596 RepID=UPI003652F052
MPVVSFPVAGRENCVVVAGTAYVYATLDGRGFVMNASCPHRGGPLHLAGVTPDAGRQDVRGAAAGRGPGRTDREPGHGGLPRPSRRRPGGPGRRLRPHEP